MLLPGSGFKSRLKQGEADGEDLKVIGIKIRMHNRGKSCQQDEEIVKVTGIKIRMHSQQWHKLSNFLILKNM